MDRKKIERISKALGDQTRLRIFEAIGSGEHITCSELVTMRGITPATVSHHLKVLQDAGLIACRRQGQFVYSRINPGVLREYTQGLSALVRRKKK